MRRTRAFWVRSGSMPRSRKTMRSRLRSSRRSVRRGTMGWRWLSSTREPLAKISVVVEMTELVGVHDRAYGCDLLIDNVERPHCDDFVFGGNDDSAGLGVHRNALHLVAADALTDARPVDQRARHH